MKQEDIDELTHLIGGSNHLAARLARERELETLVETAIVVSSRLEVPELLREIAKQMTTLLDAHMCVISEYDPSTRTVSVQAEYDDLGNRTVDTMTYTLSQFPMARKAIEDHESVTVNVSDLHADAAEVAIMRRDADKCLLILPMIHQGQAIGLLEVLDHQRERRFSRQEMRLANALAGQAAVAMHNAKLFAQLKRSDQDVLALRHAIEAIAAGHATLLSQASPTAVLQAAADLAAQALDAVSCVAGCNGVSAGATGASGGGGAGAPGAASGAGATQTDTAFVIVSTAPCGESRLALTLTLSRAAGEGQAELLGLIAAMAAGALAGLPAG